MVYPPKINPKEETEKITTFIKQTFKNTNKIKAVVAVSGGIDSAATLLLTTKALSSKNIFPIHLPAKSTGPIHAEHVNALLEYSKIPKNNFTTIPINAIIQKTWRIIKHYSPATPVAKKQSKDRRKINQHIAHLNRIRLGNIAARSRMMLIYDQAKLLNALVVGTENKSEHLLGYYTRFGDEASDLEPIRHLYKTQLIELAKQLKVPKEIINKPPTAGLWSNQTDEAELGFSYNSADPILYLHFDKHLSSKQIAKTLTTKTPKNYEKYLMLTKLILARCKANTFKHQVPYSL